MIVVISCMQRVFDHRNRF